MVTARSRLTRSRTTRRPHLLCLAALRHVERVFDEPASVMPAWSHADIFERVDSLEVDERSVRDARLAAL